MRRGSTARINGRARRAGFVCAAFLAALSLQACSTPARLGPEPAALTTKAVAIDIPNARFFPDEQPKEMFEEGVRSFQREMKARNITDPAKLPPADYLAVSGGGEDGAFGAGLLIAWTESGQRPEFKMVTGVSTGALIAPFAFLGPAYDDKLKQVFTKTSEKSIFTKRFFTAAFFDDALSDTSPLFALISGYVNDDMMKDLAREYQKGRLLFIGTTYLDARRPVIWNIGAIAASGDPKAAEVIRKILLASAAVPMAFPPVMFDVVADGQHYQEMHVDGGAFAQLFLYPPEVGRKMTGAKLDGVDVKRERRAYIIRNGRIGINWSTVERSALDIGGRSISTMIHVSGVNDLYRVYFVTQRDGVGYNLAYIEDDFKAPAHTEDFDPTYMNALFDYGYAKARHGYPWKKMPPYIEGKAN